MSATDEPAPSADGHAPTAVKPAAMSRSISSWNSGAAGEDHWSGQHPENNVSIVIESCTICFARFDDG
jgi:hypothetical protein